MSKISNRLINKCSPAPPPKGHPAWTPARIPNYQRAQSQG